MGTEYLGLTQVGCGDHEWLTEFPFEDLRVTYHGIDVSAVVIERNVRRWKSSRSHRVFTVLDAVVDPLPPSELVLIRHVLMHLTPTDNISLLRNVAKTSAAR